MAAGRYRRFLKLCEEWPVDETKRGRDLGSYLRQRVAQAFREGENTQVTGLWGPPSAGRRLGRGEERTRQGWDLREASVKACACAHLAFLAARARGPYSGGISESYSPTSHSAVSAGCTLELPEKLFIKSRCRDHSAVLNQNLWK